MGHVKASQSVNDSHQMICMTESEKIAKLLSVYLLITLNIAPYLIKICSLDLVFIQVSFIFIATEVVFNDTFTFINNIGHLEFFVGPLKYVLKPSSYCTLEWVIEFARLYGPFSNFLGQKK